ncbi:MAG: transglutaminase [bacterium]|nr:MAG: transglutaminase [bacterium]
MNKTLTALTLSTAVFVFLAIYPLPTSSYADEFIGEKLVFEQWMDVSMQGDKAGFTYRKLTQTVSGYKYTSRSVIKLKVAGNAHDVSMSQTYFLDADMKPMRFSSVTKMMGHRQHFEGEIRGGKLYVTIRSAGTVSKKTLPFDSETQMADALGFILGRKKLEEGQVYKFKVFIEPLLTTETVEVIIGKKMEIEVNGKKEKVRQTIASFSGLTVISYISDDGRIMKETSPQGFVSIAVDESQAVSFNDGVLDFTTLLTFSLIPTDKKIEDPEGIRKLELRVSGLTKENLIPGDQRQVVTNIKKVAQNGNVSYTASLTVLKGDNGAILESGGAGKNGTAEKFADYLRSTFEVQSDDPSIVLKAKEIVGGEKGAYESALIINRWVYENVEKKFIDTFSAVGTLKSLEGECQSHTNLFAALSRAVGIPVRTVSGIVYSSDFNGFLYHAWPEVYTGGGWVAMDPTFGQDAADATHIKLIEGDLAKQLRLFEFIGKIGVEIVSIERLL